LSPKTGLKQDIKQVYNKLTNKGGLHVAKSSSQVAFANPWHTWILRYKTQVYN